MTITDGHTVYKPNEFANLIGKSVATLQRWDRSGVFVANRTPTNRRFYTHSQYLELTQAPKLNLHDNYGAVVAYIRVPENAQAIELKEQSDLIAEYCQKTGMAVDVWIEDVGSALEYDRKGLRRLMDFIYTGKTARILITSSDRIVHFGYRWFEEICREHHVDLVNLEVGQNHAQSELIGDLHSLLASV